MGFICGTSMLPKSDDKHIVCLVAYEVVTYSTSIDDIAIKGLFFAIPTNSTISNKKT
jgi:hypothetical protein